MTDPAKVVVLDDSQAIGSLCKRTALNLGFEVEQYGDPVEFLGDYCRGDDETAAYMDVLLLDLVMPEMDGIEVLRALAEVESSASIILMSGFHSEVLHAAKTLANEQGLNVEGTLSKPFQIQELRWTLENLQESPSEGSTRPNLDLTQADLQRAFEKDQILAHFQPQISFETGQILGVEALARWEHPEHGLVSPGHFLPLIDTRELMETLTQRMINYSISQAANWKKQGLSLRLAINTSASVITDLSLPEQVESLANRHGLEASKITFEVTETALMEELGTSLDILTRLRIKGLELSIDDFGTGYSSLSQLHRVPFSELKVDRSFVDGATSDEESRAIAKTTITLGHELGMRVVAEGVEDQDTYDLIRQMGCDVAQGYFIAHPMPGPEIPSWVQDR